MTGGAEINFGGAREVYLCEFERGTGAREIYPSLDQAKTGDLKKKNKVFTEILSDFPAEFKNSNAFSGPKQAISKKKKVFIPRMSCKLRKYENFGLDLHSSSPNPVNFFGAPSSLGGAQFLFGGHKKSFGGARPRYAPTWRRV